MSFSFDNCHNTLPFYLLKVTCPPDYRAWQQTMYVLFGTKWAKIFAGPMWSHAPIMEAGGNTHDTSEVGRMNPVNVSVYC